MFLSKALPGLSLFLIGLTAVDASPLSRSTGKALSFSTRIDQGGTRSVVEKDRARARNLEAVRQRKRGISYSIDDSPGALSYAAQVGVGNPATNYTLVIETSTANTWVGGAQVYHLTSTSKDTGNNISLSYANHEFTGMEWTDTLTLGPDLVVNDQSIGVVSPSSGITQLEVDGVLGLGPTDLSVGTDLNKTGAIPTILDNLVSQGKISHKIFSLYFVPASESTSTGELTFDGYDDAVITSAVNYVPITQTSPASRYWGIDQSISYDGTTIQPTTSGIVDPGSTFIYMATAAYQKYVALTKGVYDNASGLLTISASQYAALRTLSFNIGGHTYDLSPNAQIWPRSLNTAIGGSSGMIYLVVAEIDHDRGFDFVVGFTFLERYYSVFDNTNGRIGFASTAYTDATTN